MEYAIKTEQLTRKFGDFTAVDHLNLNIKSGEICGFLGPNGAGKSTAIRMLCGILEPTEGNGAVLGYDLKHDSEKIKQNIGYMSQKFSLYHDLTVAENLDFFAGAYGITSGKRRRRIEEMLVLAELVGQESRMVSELSAGYKQRLALGCSLLSSPALVFLDEPTSGVSPTARRDFFNIIHSLAARGTTVIVSTHFMDEAERCDRIAFMSRGRLLAMDSPDRLRSGVIKGCLLELSVANPMNQLDKLMKLPGVMECSIHGSMLHVLVKHDKAIPALEAAAGTKAVVITPTLEDVFLALAKKTEGAATDQI